MSIDYIRDHFGSATDRPPVGAVRVACSGGRGTTRGSSPRSATSPRSG